MSADKVEFLDITVIKEGNSLTTDLYRKPTDRNTLLRRDSYHPTPLKKSLPISQFNRIKRICGSTERYEKQKQNMKERFQMRGYPEEWIDEASKRFDNISQEECLQPKIKPIKEKIPQCFITYSPLGNEFKNIIKKHWHILTTDPVLKDTFKAPPQVVYKRPPNIRSLVVRSDLAPIKPRTFLDEIPNGNYKCGNCTQCNFTYKCNSFNHPLSGKKYDIKGIISCKSTHVVYMLKCPCSLAYVGMTTRALKTRITEHRSDIRTQNIRSPVAMHFMQAGHNVSALRYIGLEKVEKPRRGGDWESLLLKREAFWIYELRTLKPFGMNLDLDIRPFL